MDTQSVKKIQDTLVQLGYMTQAEVDTGYGIYGPKTTAAMNKYVANGGKPLKTPISAPAKAPSDQPYTEQQYADALNNHPIVKEYVKKGNTAEDLAYAAETGDISGIVNQFGQPFSIQEQQDALARAEKDLEAYYKAAEEKDIADTESTIAEKKRLFQESLITAGEDFGKEKSNLDQNAVNQGVLFSGGRAQREQDLKTKYEREEASKKAGLSSDIGDTAREFQYKYGNETASKLSDLYNIGGNVYNPKVATGGVSSGGISSIYNPGAYNFQGTNLAEKKTAANKRAAGLLANRGNKLLSTGYNTQL